MRLEVDTVRCSAKGADRLGENARADRRPLDNVAGPVSILNGTVILTTIEVVTSGCRLFTQYAARYQGSTLVRALAPSRA